jgi:mRNA interferase RelE/StbE
VYQVVVERQAERDLKSLPGHMFQRVTSAIRSLGDNPRPEGCRKLVGSRRDWRIRIGDYRVIYEIDDRRRQVRILLVRHRTEAYR